MRLVALLLVLLTSTEPAHAYMGPGAGLAFLGSLIALIAALGVGVLGLVWYPLKRLIRSKRGTDGEEQDPS
jgi:hypothetical protein